ncbi:MAG TPA: hypothetical protein VGP99_06840 [Tepidisphaeraceae bacterium]|nr:hypothetical protein [Tepidisphaeraceae bacterium]
MSKTIKLSEAEWEVISELLEQERGNLRPEIRHTDSPKVHDELQERLATVSALLERMNSQPAKAAAVSGVTR